MQGGSSTSSGAFSVSYTFTGPNTAGNTLIAFVGIFGATPNTPSGASTISDSAGNSWNLINDSLEADFSNQCEVAMWYATGSHAGANTVTVANNAGVDFDLQVWEYPATLTSLDTWGGGDNSWTEDTDSQTFYSVTGNQAITTSSNDTVVVGAYNGRGANLEWALGVPANPEITPTSWTERNQSKNANGETSAFFDAEVPANVSMSVTITIPPPSLTTQPAKIADLGPFNPDNPVLSYWHPNNNYKDTLIRYPIHCGPYDYLDPSTNTFSLYTVLIHYGDASSGAESTDVFKSTDQGLTWHKTGTSPITTISTDIPYSAPVAARYGNQIYVLWYAAGLFVSTFDIPSDSWISTTAAAPGTSTPALFAAWDLCVPAAGQFFVVYNTALSGGQTSITANLYSGAWQTPVELFADAILCGLTFDSSTLTAYLTFEDFPGATTNPHNLYVAAITSFTWPIPAPTGIGLATNLPYISGYRRQPACGPAVSFLGQLYIPYMRTSYAGSTLQATYPAVFAGTMAGGFTSFDLTPNASQGFTRPDDGGHANTDIWAMAVGHNLYIVWCENGPPNRIRFCVSNDGTFPAPVSTMYDASLTVPDQLQARINATEGDNFAVYSISLNQIFGSGIGAIANLGDPQASGFDEAWYLPLSGGGPAPPKCPLGNRFY